MDLLKKLEQIKARKAEIEARIAQEKAETGMIVADFLSHLAANNPSLAQQLDAALEALPLSAADRKRVHNLVLPIPLVNSHI